MDNLFLTTVVLVMLVMVAAEEPSSYCYVPDGRPLDFNCVGHTKMPRAVPRFSVSLNMSGSHVQRIDGKALTKAGATAVKNLYFQGNDIRALHRGDTCGLDTMRVLDLSANNLETIDEDALLCNPSLKRLVLSDNPNLELSVLQSESLTDLFLDHCDISWLHVDFLAGLPNLQRLFIRDSSGISCRKVHEELLMNGYDRVEFFCTERTIHLGMEIPSPPMLSPPVVNFANVMEDISQQPELPRQRAQARDVFGQVLTIVASVPVTISVILIFFVCHYLWRRRCGKTDVEDQTHDYEQVIY